MADNRGKSAAASGPTWRSVLLLVGLAAVGCVQEPAARNESPAKPNEKPAPKPKNDSEIKFAAFVPDVDQTRVDEAIERGAKYLLHAPLVELRVGAQALAGLTLLHCGRSKDEPAVVKLAAEVRRQAPQLTMTYDLASCVLFLDRLGEPDDRELIRSIALQLIAAQGPQGGWDYTSRVLDQDERTQLLAALASGSRSANPDAKAASAPPSQARTSGSGSEAPVLQYHLGMQLPNQSPDRSDNSLTQFAILALWTAQKYDVPVDRSLAFVEARFRASQSEDGAWGYTWRSNSTYPDSMTCAGLLGLAVGRGSAAADRTGDPAAGDEAIDKGLTYVGKRLAAFRKRFAADSYGELYFLWTLERMAVAYDLKSISGIDWYAWGAPIILDRQTGAGGWHEVHGAVPDTCFALLFLKRANLALNLTFQLRDLKLSKQVVERTVPVVERAIPKGGVAPAIERAVPQGEFSRQYRLPETETPARRKDLK
jgi:hypothetical protein